MATAETIWEVCFIYQCLTIVSTFYTVHSLCLYIYVYIYIYTIYIDYVDLPIYNIYAIVIFIYIYIYIYI